MKEAVLKWRKQPRTGSHSFSYAGKRHRVVPGEIVECTRTALGTAVKYYDCLSTEPEENVEEIESGEVKNLIMVQGENDLWDIVNPDNPGKPLNQQGLSKRSAASILGKLYPIVVKEDE